MEFPTDPILAATETAVSVAYLSNPSSLYMFTFDVFLICTLICRFRQSVSNMDVDGTSTVSPLISQYAAHQNLQKNCTTVDPVHEVTVHNAPQQTPPVHTTPIHNQRGVQSSSVHDTAVQNLKSPVPSAYASYDTSANDLHDSPAATPKSPPFQEMLFSDVQIHSPMCPDPITPTQPKYDSSAGPASRRACLFPLSPHPSSKDNSPTKSPASISGFAVHASVLNAFSATATSQTHVASETVEVDEVRLILCTPFNCDRLQCKLKMGNLVVIGTSN